MAVLVVIFTITGVVAVVLVHEDEALLLQRWVWPLRIEAFKIKLKCSCTERISDYKHFVRVVSLKY